ncbi:BTAD domain-containing putative transcriptional regulator [Roseibium sp.]|uniref:BTAD domain-containing putative transcriptional regulator n=1 Tax=Roseibium sp. TaxID=1936156 RepID=UPI003B50717C
MANASCFACLGRPLLLSENGEPAAVKTRKALAIMGYLSRVGGMNAPRETLADLLWSNAERPKAMQSLRQALRQLKTAEQSVGHDVVHASSNHVKLDQATFSSDLAHLFTLLERGGTKDFGEAEELWRGEFLAGFEDIDPEFSDWLQVERERIRSEVVTAAFRHLTQVANSDGGEQIEAGARFLLKTDPAFEPAHRVLIRLYVALGQGERAREQFKACEREMRIHLDAEPDEETRALLTEDVEEAWHMKEFKRPGEVQPMATTLSNSDSVVRLPEISVVSASLSKSGLNDAIYLREEIVSGLSSFRSFDLYQTEYFGEENAPSPTLVEGHELGSYLLRFRYDDRSGKVVVQFEDRGSGQIVFNDIVDLSFWNGILPAASHIVSRVHSHATERLRNPANTSIFARWCQVEALLWDFTPHSDEKAMHLLNDMQKSNKQFSRTYAGKASIIMKQALHFPLHDRATTENFGELLNTAEQAIVLDPWQAVNQRVYGWALILSNMPEEARRAFYNAGRLSSADPANLMSVAEGLAFSGDVEEARLTAEKAFDLFAFVPRVFYEYLANIYFAAEDYEGAVQQIERGTGVSVKGLTTRVAALVCSGRREEAIKTLERYSEHRLSLLKSSPGDFQDPEDWRRRVNFFQNERVRANYDKGAELVQRFIFKGEYSV